MYTYEIIQACNIFYRQEVPLWIWRKSNIRINRMAKDKKGGKKGGKKKAEPEETDTMTEVEKELFQIQINDLQQKVERHV